MSTTYAERSDAFDMALVDLREEMIVGIHEIHIKNKEIVVACNEI